MRAKIALIAAPGIPQGITVTRVRMYMSGAELQMKMLAGLKWVTTRNWADETVKAYRKCCAKGEAVRVQSNYGYWTIYAWATIARVSKRTHPTNLIDSNYLRLAGCAEMSPKDYITKYCSDSIPDASQPGKMIHTPSQSMVSVYYKALWTRKGEPILRAIPND